VSITRSWTMGLDSSAVHCSYSRCWCWQPEQLS